jgi:predicted DNA-binding WGR domain protein
VVTRSFEFVGGDSAKFWEITDDGLDLTVRYGRLGTNGQSKTTTFGSVEAAAAQAGKLIAEKIRKGYAETGAAAAPAVPQTTAPRPAPTPVAPTPVAAAPVAPAPAPVAPSDEDTLVVPAAWRRHLFTRRGGAGVAPVRPAAGARAAWDATVVARPVLEGMGQRPGSDRAVVRAARAHLTGDPTPLGAAALVAATAAVTTGGPGPVAITAGLWLAEYGVEFAALAAVELMALRCDPPYSVGADHGLRHLRPGEDRQIWYGDVPLLVAGKIRCALAASDDDTYAATVAALGARRQDGLFQRVTTSSWRPPRRPGWTRTARRSPRRGSRTRRRSCSALSPPASRSS